jgi:hypothetical protein
MHHNDVLKNIVHPNKYVEIYVILVITLHKLAFYWLNLP